MARKRKRLSKNKLPRYWRKTIAAITGLQYCDRDCDCGDNAQLWYFPPGTGWRDMPDWVPGWMNGVSSFEIWEWLIENGRTKIPQASST